MIIPGHVKADLMDEQRGAQPEGAADPADGSLRPHDQQQPRAAARGRHQHPRQDRRRGPHLGGQRNFAENNIQKSLNTVSLPKILKLVG